jgi:hypothetical protein
MSVSQSIGSALDIPITGKNSAIYAALRILRRPGIEAHVYTAGANGAVINALQSNNYTLSDGSTGYSTVDGSAGLVLDGMGSVGAELVTNGDFASSAGWTLDAGWSIAGGLLTATAAGTYTSCHRPLLLTQGLTYLVSIDCLSISGNAYITTSDGVNHTEFTTAGTKTFIYTHGAGSSDLFIATSSAGFSSVFDNISVREVTGIHATQPTTAYKPAVRRGLLNLLPYSQDFTNAAWAKNSGGTATAKTITFVGDTSNFQQNITVSPTAIVTFAAILSCPSGPIVLNMALPDGSDGTPYYNQDITVTTTPTMFVFSQNLAAIAGFSGTLGVIYRKGGGATIAGSVVTVDSQGVFLGTLTAAQILSEGGIPLTTSAAASNPSAGRYWWGFGPGDYFTMPQAAYGIADDFVVIAAASCDNKAAYPFPISAAKGLGSNASIGGLYFDAAGFASTLYNSDAAIATFVIGPLFSDSTPCVISHSKQAGLCRTDVNNTLGAPVAAPGGVYTVDYGRLGEALNGAFSCAVIVKGSLSESDILTLKRFAASTLPSGPVF